MVGPSHSETAPIPMGGQGHPEVNKPLQLDAYVNRTVAFNSTPTTRKFDIAGAEGRVKSIKGNELEVLYDDPIYGPKGPYLITLEDVETILH